MWIGLRGKGRCQSEGSCREAGGCTRGRSHHAPPRPCASSCRCIAAATTAPPSSHASVTASVTRERTLALWSHRYAPAGTGQAATSSSCAVSSSFIKAGITSGGWGGEAGASTSAPNASATTESRQGQAMKGAGGRQVTCPATERVTSPARSAAGSDSSSGGGVLPPRDGVRSRGEAAERRRPSACAAAAAAEAGTDCRAVSAPPPLPAPAPVARGPPALLLAPPLTARRPPLPSPSPGAAGG